ncbi:energy-coupling factor ABC transporter ATP-binding protein [Virgibacillus doumboii]|uniref:energy-coupling factor ABC transporter ATP-binding protein n=1 Tax=Virgibacillus doumboii TaxID=2697503 RepID=UPI0013E05522|nr:ATP-binding cassette domain-containing protein [Virgibacillus doumboii]
MSIIDVEGLKYKYPDTDKLVLNDISFKVEKGEFIGLIGRNTAGKSSLCFALTGLVPHFFKGAYGGKVLIDGMELKKQDIGEIAAKVGLVFENPFSQMTGSKFSVYEEIAFGLENMGVERKEMITRIDESLELLDITAIKDKNPFDLSGGQMQRVAIASVIAMRPDVLILDEPTSQLDPQGSAEVFKVVENLTKEGITIMMAEHKMEKISQYADKVLLLDDGKLIDYDTPANVFSRDDLLDHGIAAPVVTRVAKALGMKDSGTGAYPVTLSEISREKLVIKDD